MWDWAKAIEENSLLFVLLTNWIPILITVFGGGFAASILFPRLQASALRRKELYKRKSEISEEVAREFPVYAIYWHRLLSISNLEETRELTDVEKERKRQFIQRRAEARDRLHSAFALCLLYFSDNVCAKVEAFQIWDEAQSDKRLGELASPEEWRVWNKSIVEALKNEVHSR